MKILVVTGTTPFSGLENAVFRLADELRDINFTLQTRANHVGTSNLEIVTFLDDEKYWLQFDLVLTHCGAGTIFTLLEEVKNLSQSQIWSAATCTSEKFSIGFILAGIAYA